jgi:hypothetical protein
MPTFYNVVLIRCLGTRSGSHTEDDRGTRWHGRRYQNKTRENDFSREASQIKAMLYSNTLKLSKHPETSKGENQRNETSKEFRTIVPSFPEPERPTFLSQIEKLEPFKKTPNEKGY